MRTFADFKRRLKTAHDNGENITFTRTTRRDWADGKTTEDATEPAQSKIKKVQTNGFCRSYTRQDGTAGESWYYYGQKSEVETREFSGNCARFTIGYTHPQKVYTEKMILEYKFQD